MKILLSSLAVVISTAVLSAQAEPIKVDMKAGLWENTMTWDADSAKEMQAMQTDQMKVAMEQMKEQFANMPPEQRKQMEAVMAQAGMEIKDDSISFQNDQVQISSSGTTAKTCITQAEIDRGELPDDVEGCTSTLKKISATRFKSTYVCSGEEQSTGESEVNFHSPKHYSGTGTMVHVMNGEKRTMNFKMEGKWLGANCGDIKPAQ